jgi:hypothetical protein
MTNKLKHDPVTLRPRSRGRQDASDRLKLVINHGMAIERFRKQVDLQLTELAVGIAEIKSLLKSKEPA